MSPLFCVLASAPCTPHPPPSFFFRSGPEAAQASPALGRGGGARGPAGAGPSAAAPPCIPRPPPSLTHSVTALFNRSLFFVQGPRQRAQPVLRGPILHFPFHLSINCQMLLRNTTSCSPPLVCDSLSRQSLEPAVLVFILLAISVISSSPPALDSSTEQASISSIHRHFRFSRSTLWYLPEPSNLVIGSAGVSINIWMLWPRVNPFPAPISVQHHMKCQNYAHLAPAMLR